MAEGKKLLTVDERMTQVSRDKRRVLRARMQRDIAGVRWSRMVRIMPVFFERTGSLHAHVVRSDRSSVIDALRLDAVFALDTAMRMARGYGFLSSGDIHAYLLTTEPLVRLAETGRIEGTIHPDDVLVRPWAGPNRLLVSVVREFPPHCELESGHRVVTDERLRRELIGAVGARTDLFALLDS